AAPHAPDAGAHGADDGAVRFRSGAVMTRDAVAAALVLAIGAFAQSTPPIAHEFAEVNGVRLHYATAGRGPLMLFLHGFPEFWYEWTHQIAEFSRDHTAVAPDMRGYNLSSKPADLDAYQ